MQQQPVTHDPSQCPCKSVNCERNRNCEACQAYHRAAGGMTTCERKAKRGRSEK